MKTYIIETKPNFRMSDIHAFDESATGVEVMPIKNLGDSGIWKIETTLSLTQLFLLRSVSRAGRLPR